MDYIKKITAVLCAAFLLPVNAVFTAECIDETENISQIYNIFSLFIFIPYMRIIGCIIPHINKTILIILCFLHPVQLS